MGDSKPHLLMVFGTRPEAIKMMPLVKAIRTKPSLRLTVAVTGQHREMLDQVFQAFREAPDIDLALMRANQTLPEITARVIERMTDPPLPMTSGWSDWNCGSLGATKMSTKHGRSAAIT